MNRQQGITYLAAAGNVGLWVMAGIARDGGTLPPLVHSSIVLLSSLALGLSVVFGIVEISVKLSSLPAEFERTRKDGSVKVTKNRRYQMARFVLVLIIGGESFILMPVGVMLANKVTLPEVLPGFWMWLWVFGTVTMSSALLAGLSAVLESKPKAETSRPKQDESKPEQTKAEQSKTEAEPKQAEADESKQAPLYSCSLCSWDSSEAERSGRDPRKAKNGHALKHKSKP